MSGATYLCETDGTCPRHGRFIWFCHPCHEEWRARNPHTSKAIEDYTAGRGTLAAINTAKQADTAGST